MKKILYKLIRQEKKAGATFRTQKTQLQILQLNKLVI